MKTLNPRARAERRRVLRIIQAHRDAWSPLRSIPELRAVATARVETLDAVLNAVRAGTRS
jgi:hypothetical protein